MMVYMSGGVHVGWGTCRYDGLHVGMMVYMSVYMFVLWCTGGPHAMVVYTGLPYVWSLLFNPHINSCYGAL